MHHPGDKLHYQSPRLRELYFAKLKLKIPLEKLLLFEYFSVTLIDMGEAEVDYGTSPALPYLKSKNSINTLHGRNNWFLVLPSIFWPNRSQVHITVTCCTSNNFMGSDYCTTGCEHSLRIPTFRWYCLQWRSNSNSPKFYNIYIIFVFICFNIFSNFLAWGDFYFNGPIFFRALSTWRQKYACAYFVLSAISMYIIPETKGNTLKKIQSLLYWINVWNEIKKI